MERKQSKPQESTLLPRRALPCVWMTAGLVAYKLCDREFDCEHCPFDVALQGGPQRSEEQPGEKIRSARWEFRDDRRYHSCHGWVMSLSKTSVRYGVDVFAGRLLDHVTSVVLPPIGNHLLQGRPACWMMDESELIPLCAPITGTVLRRNSEVQQNPSLVTTSPYDDGWLLEVQSDTGLDEYPDLISAEELRERTAHQLKKLQERGLHRPSTEAELGPTLADGGEPVDDLRRKLSTRRYHRLVLQFLS